MFATCTEKKARLIFGANFVAKENIRKFPKNTVFWFKTRCKTAAAPQIDKKHSWRCPPKASVSTTSRFFIDLGQPGGKPQTCLWHNMSPESCKKNEKRISSRGHPGYLRCGFPSKITFWVVFTAPQGVQTPLRDAFWHLKVLKAEGL